MTNRQHSKSQKSESPITEGFHLATLQHRMGRDWDMDAYLNERADRRAARKAKLSNTQRRSRAEFEEDWEYSIQSTLSPADQLKIDRAFQKEDRKYR